MRYKSEINILDKFLVLGMFREIIGANFAPLNSRKFTRRYRRRRNCRSQNTKQNKYWRFIFYFFLFGRNQKLSVIISAFICLRKFSRMAHYGITLQGLYHKSAIKDACDSAEWPEDTHYIIHLYTHITWKSTLSEWNWKEK